MVRPTSDNGNTHWDILPSVPMELVFKFLDNGDRLNASLVCKDWYNAFECGSLWKKFSFVFQGDMVDDARIALKFVKKHAASLRQLTIEFQRINMVLIQDGMDGLKHLFEHLESSCQLHDFQLENYFHVQQTNLSRSLNSRLANDAFKAFIRAQKNLKKLDCFNVQLSETDGLDILTEIAAKNESLQSLGLTHFFEATVDVHSNASFHNAMRKFRGLKEVRLSYQCVSNEVLEILCLSQESSLQHMIVTCDSSESLRHGILHDSWSKLRQKYPDLKISFHVVEIVTQDQFVSLLPRATKICGLSYRCGLSLQSELSLRTHALPILQYLEQAFPLFLRSIKLEFGFVSIPNLDSAILDLLKNCKRIENLHLSGVLRIELAIKVCKIALRKDSELKNIFLDFFFTRIETIEEMNHLYEYHKQLKIKKIKFHFNLLSLDSPR